MVIPTHEWKCHLEHLPEDPVGHDRTNTKQVQDQIDEDRIQLVPIRKLDACQRLQKVPKSRISQHFTFEITRAINKEEQLYLTFESIQYTTFHSTPLPALFGTSTDRGYDSRISGVRDVPRCRSSVSVSKGISIKR